ncbi:MAG: dCMP deaminase family protein [Coriobacteriia bacterium]|nr:dCMP deaminase family protein [Coriobacteriia bacterium]
MSEQIGTQTDEDRPSWDEYFMSIADKVSERSTCIRRHVGAVVVKDKRILATGYNGAPVGVEHCTTRGCLRDQLGIPSGERHELCRGTHAEQNALMQAARYGIPIDGAMVYCTTQPCIQCAKMLINAGICEIVFEGEYPDALARELLAEAGMRVRVFSEEK